MRYIRKTNNRARHPEIVWVTRSFLDYRIPVFKALDALLGHHFTIVYSKEYVPKRVCDKIQDTFHNRAVGLTGEWKIGPEDRHAMANQNINLRFNPGLLKTIKRLKPDLIIGDGFFKWTFASILHKLRHKTPVVICYERTFHVERNAQWYRTLYRRGVIKLTDAMCCSGKECGEYTKWLGMDPARITYGHMAADTHGLANEVSKMPLTGTAELRRHLNINGLLFLYVGSLSERKGVKQLLEAWAEFNKIKHTPKTLMLMGDGDRSEELRHFCNHEGLNNVLFPGEVEYTHIAKYYSVADVFIIPTLEDNWSLVVPEAMACGLPILCSKYNGCWPEMVKTGENGWDFDPLNKSDMINVLTWCIDNKDKLADMGLKSKEIVQSFNPENAAQSILDACKIALNHR